MGGFFFNFFYPPPPPRVLRLIIVNISATKGHYMFLWYLLTNKFVEIFNSSSVILYIYSFGASAHSGPWPSPFTRFLDHTQRRTTIGRTPLDEWSARRRDLYLTTHSTHNRQTSMPSVGFEPTISAGERPQTYALDRAATVTGHHVYSYLWISYIDTNNRY